MSKKKLIIGAFLSLISFILLLFHNFYSFTGILFFTYGWKFNVLVFGMLFSLLLTIVTNYFLFKEKKISYFHFPLMGLFISGILYLLFYYCLSNTIFFENLFTLAKVANYLGVISSLGLGVVVLLSRKGILFNLYGISLLIIYLLSYFSLILKLFTIPVISATVVFSIEFLVLFFIYLNELGRKSRKKLNESNLVDKDMG